MQNLKIWCNDNKLQINPQKSSVLAIPFKLTSPSIDLNKYCNDCLMVCQNSCKYLGANLDSKLHFQPHISKIEIKVAKAVGISSKLQFHFPKSTLILLYNAFIHPHLLHALLLWGSTFLTYLTKLQRLQNKILRIIFNCKQFNSVTPLFHKLETLKMRDLYHVEISKLMYLHSKKSRPHCFLDLFIPTSTIHSRAARSQSQNLYPPKYSTSRCQRSITFQGVKIWNAVPTDIRNLSFNKFKTTIKKQILDRHCK